MASVAEQIRNKNAEFLEALRNHDAAAMMAMYLHEARLLAPGSEMVEGPSKIQAFWQNAIQSGITDAKLETIDVDLLGGYTALFAVLSLLALSMRKPVPRHLAAGGGH